MNRVTAVTAAVATATVAGAVAAAAAMAPAMAAARPVPAHSAAHAKTTVTHAKTTAVHAKTAKTGKTAKTAKTAAQGGSNAPTVIDSELDGGKYVTVVRCQGVDSPPPVTLGKPDTPLTVHGQDPAATVVKALTKANPYKTIYTCTVVVQQKVPPKPKPTPHKPACEFATGTGGSGGSGGSGGAAGHTCTTHVTLNTGFGGLAPQVKNHTPAG
jgi:hypothetical protein